MAGYLGAVTVGLDVTSVDVEGDITSTDASPEVTLQNTTEEDTDGGRESKITFKGEQSGGEITTLAQIQASHDGTADDEKGDLIFSTNDGADGNTPTERMRIDADGNVGIGTNAPSALLEIDNGGTSTGDVMVFNLGSEDREHSFENIIATGRDLRLNTARDYRIKYGADTAGFPTEGEMIFEHGTNGEAMRIDSSKRVGIGTNSPYLGSSGRGLHVKGPSGYTSVIKVDSTTTSQESWMQFSVDGTDKFRIASDSSTNLKFVHSGVAERMRIESSGHVRIGTGNGSNTQGPRFYGGVPGNGTNHAQIFPEGDGSTVAKIYTGVNSTSGRFHIIFENNNGTVGSVTTSGSSTAFNTTSDYRLKENVTDVTDGITRVKQLAPKRFNFIADPDTTVDGFIAHEAQAVVPEAVFGTHNEVDDDNNPVYQGIDQSKLVPLLTAALQEAIAKIETLETKVAALESA